MGITLTEIQVLTSLEANPERGIVSVQVEDRIIATDDSTIPATVTVRSSTPWRTTIPLAQRTMLATPLGPQPTPLITLSEDQIAKVSALAGW